MVKVLEIGRSLRGRFLMTNHYNLRAVSMSPQFYVINEIFEQFDFACLLECVENIIITVRFSAHLIRFEISKLGFFFHFFFLVDDS